MPRRRKWQPTPVSLPGQSHGQRNLVRCSPWGHKELETTEWLSTLGNLWTYRTWQRSLYAVQAEIMQPAETLQNCKGFLYVRSLCKLCLMLLTLVHWTHNFLDHCTQRSKGYPVLGKGFNLFIWCSLLPSSSCIGVSVWLNVGHI